MIYNLDNDKFMFVIKRQVGLEDFLTVGKTLPHSYAEELMRRIYEILVVYSVDVQAEFNIYYGEEYDNLADYLYWKYEVDRSITEKAQKGLTNDAVILYGDATSGGDYPLAQLITSEELTELMNQLVGMV